MLGFSRFFEEVTLSLPRSKRVFLPESEYWAKVNAGEIKPRRADAKVIRGPKLIAQVQAESGRECLIAFSAGKDSLAAYLYIRRKFERVVPFYMFLVPDLEFVEESLRYFELKLTDEPIIRMPHPQLYRMLGHCIFQPPERLPMLDAAAMDTVGYTNEMLRELVIEESGISPTAYVATGVRAADSPLRRLGIIRHGPINRVRKTFMPIWDWNKARTMATIRGSRLRLPVDYELFGRSLDGIGYEYLAPIRKHFPRDYQRILDWFPLADMELWRMERFRK